MYVYSHRVHGIKSLWRKDPSWATLEGWWQKYEYVIKDEKHDPLPKTYPHPPPPPNLVDYRQVVIRDWFVLAFDKLYLQSKWF